MRRPTRRTIAALGGFALLPALALAAPATAQSTDVEHAAAAQEQWRGYWVDAFNEGIYDAAEVTELVSEAQDLGANALVVQVGRRFDCFCNDALYPRTDAGIDPAPYDPLAEVIDQAHAAGIEVHAWVNATTLWNSATPPSSPEHAFNAHGLDAEGRDRWLNKRVDGSEKIGNNTYIDPANPDAVDYVVDAVTSITENYDVDGVNLDYIRYPDYNTAGVFVNDWGYSDTSLSRFAAETGRTDVPAPDDEQFSDWRRDQVSNLVRKIFVAMYQVDDSDRLSINGITYAYGPASYGGWEGTRPYAEVLQDWKGWLDEGIVDTVTAMNYKRNWMPEQARMFTEWNDALIDYRADRHVVNGPALYLNDIDDAVAQATETVEAGFDGWMGYSYANPTQDATASGDPAVKDAERAALVDALRADVFAEDVVVPEMTWKTAPTTGNVSGTVTLGSRDAADQVDVVLHPVAGTPGEKVFVRTDGSGWFGAVDLAPGRYRVQVVEDGAEGTASTFVRVGAGEVAEVDVRAESLS
ncbi:family 10 glycosylhydrolase [Georgenia subflava]|uniref:Family 10 glycosylhydrolase n=1 Tax=Georgenia subflava TaxID=1622177 RepID=A0A6N7EMQ1_9MICO|nr:family 10 glycosylhydrolase [Georgenia subflava]MPV38711.1 family 10 glycosylhydrolase [Georgenia subflava]